MWAGERLHEDEPTRILVIRFSSLGDLVLITPVLRMLRDHFPEARIDLATKAEYAGFFAACAGPLVDMARPLVRGQSLVSYIGTLRQDRYDIVIDLHRTLRARAVFLAVPARRRLAYNKRALRRRLLVAIGAPSPGSIAVPELYAGPLRRLGIRGPVPRAELHPSARGIAEVDELLRDLGTEVGGGGIPSMIAIAPGARWATKRWPVERFVGLARVLIERFGVRVVAVGDEGDRQPGAELAGRVGSGVLDATGRLSLEGTAALIGRCRMFVGNDSGLMHMAAALSVPVVALFGPTVRDFGFGPWSAQSRVVETSLACRPCSTHGTNYCPLGHHRCMRDLSVDVVEKAVAELWPRERPRASTAS
ncbi:MAG: glycosyltransferase family 9 protein [Gemmatimonadota bacterium]